VSKKTAEPNNNKNIKQNKKNTELNNSRKSIMKVAILIVVMFAVSMAVTLKIAVYDSQSMIVNAYNPRINSADSTIKRGEIRDIDGYVYAYSEKKGEVYQRKYNDAKTTSHVVGYVSAGKSGIEASGNFTLEHISNELVQRFKSFFFGTDIEGDNICLTVDKDLQDIASSIMKTNKGAVVVQEVSTGRILAMVSKPGFDPSTVYQNWSSIKEDETSPLVNRAAQGKYTPGSVFKIITAVSAIRNIGDIESFAFECDGSFEIDGQTIHCYDSKAHGLQTFEEAFANSCNGAFAQLGLMLGGETLRETADQLLLNSGVSFLLNYSVPEVTLNANSTENEIAETSMGQGRTTVTPLYMASLAAAIANNGIMMKPYIIDHVEDFSGNITSTTVPEKFATLFTEEECEKLTEMMVKVINEGTGYNADSEYFQVAGKTGTAENAGGNDHLWFVGFAPADNPQYAVSVVLENNDGSANASVVARKMLYNAIYREDLN